MAYVESRNRATSDPGARRDVVAEIEARGIEDVLLWFTDLEGHLKSFAITRSEVEGALDDGMGFDGSSITGFNAIEESDMVAIPDPETFRVLPDGRAGRMICDVVTPDGEAYDGDPRHALRRALDRMQSMGFDTFNVGPEAEYFLFKEGRNQFFAGDDQYFLSPVGKAFIAGQLKHAREISSLFAQWVNSYKRLVPGYEAPVYVAWSLRNRSALIRIPLYKPGSEQATRAELRCPDPACNPYLLFAALLHAGLEGIEQGYELPPPMETNLYHLTAEQRRERGIVSLPETLGEAIDVFAQSELMRSALGAHIFDRYVELKRKEWDEYRVQLTQWELDRYLGVL